MNKIIYIMAVCALTGCKTTQMVHMTGNDRDKHNCIPSAGYVWSNVREECIRTFEVGIPLHNLKNPAASSAAYIVFSNDSIYAEAYIPEIKGSIIMRQKKADCWKGHGYALMQTTQTHYTLYKKQQIIYSNHQ